MMFRFVFLTQHLGSCNPLVGDGVSTYLVHPFTGNVDLWSLIFMGEVSRGRGWPLIFVPCDSLYSVRPDKRSSNSSGSINVPRATASCSAPVTLLSSFFHLLFWPENLLLSCQHISAFRKTYFPRNFSVFPWKGQSTNYEECNSYYLTSSIHKHLKNHYQIFCDSRILL